MDKCSNCNERPVHVKKRGLCSTCYQRLRRDGLLKFPVPAHGRRDQESLIRAKILDAEAKIEALKQKLKSLETLQETKAVLSLTKAAIRSERAEYYASQISGGATLQEIADAEGVTRERVRQVLLSCGYRTRLIKPKREVAPITKEEKLTMMAWRLAFDIEIAGDDECWMWTGAKWQANRTYCKTPYYVARTCGYDPIDSDISRHTSAPRLMYQLFEGDLQEGMQIDHICNNSLCCNPAHMQAVTKQEHGRLTQQRLREKRLA